RVLADENEAMLIFDEVQTGVGLTGTMWAHEQMGVKPDIMAFGKKMQVCGIVVTDRVDEIETNVFKVSSRINSTWGGNLVDMVRATRYLEIIHDENLVQNAAERGAELFDKLHILKNEFPEYISNVRHRGLFAAFDFDNAENRTRFTRKCFDEGLIILPCGEKSVRFRPPLNITSEQIDEGLEVIRKVMKEL
ncbi:MAG TPA: aminotransferase class III-fold pyridoxal phosphate-dependent enzyme, partial [Candidatus Kapabacteria bacterium]|nr:aminotransferase class III-fold pyridoxal phosphate-dependent enzyme [Candidatus Kapabacteria bacterium]